MKTLSRIGVLIGFFSLFVVLMAQDVARHETTGEKARDLAALLLLPVIGGSTLRVIHEEVRRRQAAEAALRASRARFDSLARAANDAVWEWDMEVNRLWWSEGIYSLFRYTVAGVVPDAAWRLSHVHPDDRKRVIASLRDALNTGMRYWSSEYSFERGDGTYARVLDRAHVVCNELGNPIRVIGTMLDITGRWEAEQALREANSRLEALATRDGLTGLNNHRVFQERLEMEFQRATRHNEPLSLLLIDVDRFKRFNDSFGHLSGDAVLKTVAAQLSAEARETDLVARYGGEEFVVVLPHTDAEGARRVGERLRTAVAGVAWPQRKVTISLGAATLIPAMETRCDLIAAADAALYEAKRAGRNRVVSSTPSADADRSEDHFILSPPENPVVV